LSDRAVAGAFAAARARGRVALIPYITAGYPSAAESRELLKRLPAAGADLIEVGIPFSDPIADGPTIQRSTHRALEQGMTVRGALELIQSAAPSVPIVVMTYVNPILAYGLERFLADAAQAGVSAVLCTDLPAGAAPEMERAIAAAGLDQIRLVAPTTPDDRLRTMLGPATGFVYFISRLGVTGVRAEAPPDLERHLRRIRAVTALPVAVGFGIGTPAQVAAAARWADGVVVGSAVIEALSSGGVAAAERLVRELAA
jgi:tryptophan synthase alpha chain